MGKEYGEKWGLLKVEKEKMKYMKMKGREENSIEMVEEYWREKGMWRD